MICATWNSTTNRLNDPFIDNRQIGASNGGAPMSKRLSLSQVQWPPLVEFDTTVRHFDGLEAVWSP
jgi:hypothetical protein